MRRDTRRYCIIIIEIELSGFEAIMLKRGPIVVLRLAVSICETPADNGEFYAGTREVGVYFLEGVDADISERSGFLLCKGNTMRSTKAVQAGCNEQNIYIFTALNHQLPP